MLELYMMNMNRNLENTTFEYLLSKITPERRDKIRKFHFKEDALRTLYGEIIVRTLISKKLRLKNDDIIFTVNNYGKPFIEDHPLHFNISHAGDWVVCAISSQEVGVDIELVKPIDFSIAKRFFNSNEYVSLLNRNDEEKLSFFYEIWTLKESYIKWIGEGLSIPLDSFFFTLLDNEIFLIDNNRKTIPDFKQYFIDKDYKLAVCSLNSIFADKVQQIDINYLKREI